MNNNKKEVIAIFFISLLVSAPIAYIYVSWAIGW